jgi:hypothetical protein
MKLTLEQWEAKGRELFGDDKSKWRFVCPSCGNVMSIEKAKAEFTMLQGRGWRPEAECVGRYLDDVGCDWAAYGLFRGPLIVKVDGDDIMEIFAFDFDGKPFTGGEKK